MYSVQTDKNRPTLETLANTSINSPIPGQTLAYNGATWNNSLVLSSGTFMPTTFLPTGCNVTSIDTLYWTRLGDVVTCFWRGKVTVQANVDAFAFVLSIPIEPFVNFTEENRAAGYAGPNTRLINAVWTGGITSQPNNSGVAVWLRTNTANGSEITDFEVLTHFSYNLT